VSYVGFFHNKNLSLGPPLHASMLCMFILRFIQNAKVHFFNSGCNWALLVSP
jgi:hypothetical protein